jgi:predicted ATP-grasp superfamily ATP-dependent carboligase
MLANMEVGAATVFALQAEQYRGAADAAEEFLGFLLHTTAAAAAAPGTTPPPLPFLPPGSIVSGLAAAVLTQAELRSIPGQLLVAVEKVPRLVPGIIPDLAAAATRALQQLSPAAAAVLGPPLQDKAALAAAAAACRKQVVPPAIYV